MSVEAVVVKDTQDLQQNTSHKRKRLENLEELEIDVNAVEPPSKKQARKAKKGRVTPKDTSASDNSTFATKKRDEDDQAKNPSGKPGRSQFGIWIGNLSFTTTNDDLMTFITSDADHPIERDRVTRIHLPSGPSKVGKPQNRGFAYIDFADVTSLNHALQLSEKLFGGRRVLIKDAKSFEGRPASKEDVAAGKSPSRRIFVGNLSFDTTSEALEKHFGICGKIQKIQIATFEDSGKCKGYAWVEFEQLSSAESAMRGWVEQDSDDPRRQSKRRIWLKKMDGRQLRMEYAEDATTRYNKRYGKEGKSKQNNVENEDKQDLPIEEVNSKTAAIFETRSKRIEEQRPKQRRGYEKETVQRLKGAITEGQGQKVVFD